MRSELRRFPRGTNPAVTPQIGWVDEPELVRDVTVAIVKKRLKTEASLYTILQILSLTLFEKTPLDQPLTNIEMQTTESGNDNQLNLFN